MWSVLIFKLAVAPHGKLSRPDLGSSKMIVTFRVQRTYKGDLGQEIEIQTGLGGGGQGAVYAPGLADSQFSRAFPVFPGVSMCSRNAYSSGRIAISEEATPSRQ